MKKKIMATILTITLIASVIAGCGGNSSTTATDNGGNGKPASEAGGNGEVESTSSGEETTTSESGTEVDSSEATEIEEENDDKGNVPSFPYAASASKNLISAGIHGEKQFFSDGTTLNVGGLSWTDNCLNKNTYMFLEVDWKEFTDGADENDLATRARAYVHSESFSGPIEDWVDLDFDKDEDFVRHYWGVPKIADWGTAAIWLKDGNLMWVNCMTGDVQKVSDKEPLGGFSALYGTCISPDGQTVAFVAESNGETSLRIWKSDGTLNKVADGYVPLCVSNNAEYIYCYDAEYKPLESYSLYILNTEGVIDSISGVFSIPTEFASPTVNWDATEVFIPSRKGGPAVWADGVLYELDRINIWHWDFYGCIKPEYAMPYNLMFYRNGREYKYMCPGEKTFKGHYYLNDTTLYYINDAWEVEMIEKDVNDAAINITEDTICYIHNGELLRRKRNEGGTEILADHVVDCEVTSDGEKVFYLDEQDGLWIWADGDAQRIGNLSCEGESETRIQITSDDNLLIFKRDGELCFSKGSTVEPIDTISTISPKNTPWVYLTYKKDTGMIMTGDADKEIWEAEVKMIKENLKVEVLDSNAKVSQIKSS